MRSSRLRAALILTAAFTLAPAAHAAVDAFITFEDGSIQGESRDPQHSGWIEVESFQLQELARQVSAPGAAGGGGVGKVHFRELTVTKRYDKSSPLLFVACASGKHYPKVLIEMRKAGGAPQEYLKITLTNTLISSIQLTGGGAPPTETIKFNFGATEVEYTPQTKGNNAGAMAVAPATLKVLPTATPTPAGRAQAPAAR